MAQSFCKFFSYIRITQSMNFSGDNFPAHVCQQSYFPQFPKYFLSLSSATCVLNYSNKISLQSPLSSSDDLQRLKSHSTAHAGPLSAPAECPPTAGHNQTRLVINRITSASGAAATAAGPWAGRSLLQDQSVRSPCRVSLSPSLIARAPSFCHCN